MESFLGAGDLYFDRLTSAGVRQGAKLEGACTQFALQTESEVKEQTGKGRINYGQVIASATVPGKTTVKVTINQIDAENLAVLFGGDVVAGQQASGSIDAGSPMSVTAIHDRYVEIGKESLSNIVVKDESDVTTYTAGEDYILHARLGMIKVLSTGAITDGDVLHISGDYGAVGFKKVTGGTSPILRARMVLDGQNYQTGRNCKVVVKDARLKSNTELDFLSDDFLPLELEGVCEIPEGEDTPFDITWYDE